MGADTVVVFALRVHHGPPAGGGAERACVKIIIQQLAVPFLAAELVGVDRRDILGLTDVQIIPIRSVVEGLMAPSAEATTRTFPG